MKQVVLEWHRFTQLTEARDIFADTPCIYVQTDRDAKPVRVGKASKGLQARYRGGMEYALDAAMHRSGNKVFVARVPSSQCDDVERALIWQLRDSLPYNNQGKLHRPAASISIIHRETSPTFQEESVVTTRRAYVGVDVAFAKRKYLPVSVCVQSDGRLTPVQFDSGAVLPPRGSGNVAALDVRVVQQFARDTTTFLKDVARNENLEIVRIAIDAPCDYRAEDQPRRAAESAMDAEGISCFATPSRSDFKRIREKVAVHLRRGGSVARLPHSNQLWMLVGFALFQELSKLAECIEVFPQAIVRAIGAGDIHKFKREGLQAQISAAARFTGWPDGGQLESRLERSGDGPKHDKLDAYLSAWVASLEEGDRVAFGIPPHDVIWAPRTSEAFPPRVPRSPAATHAKPPRPRSQNRLPSIAAQGIDPGGLSAKDVSGKAVLCPACHSKVFAKWPSGWDAHAAHACDGYCQVEATSGRVGR